MSGGSCDYGDGEPVRCYSERQRVARKAWCCGDCGETIKAGETYHYERYMCDGHWYETRTCLSCDSVLRYLWDMGAECLYRGSLKSWLTSDGGEDGEGLAPHYFIPGGEYENCPRPAWLASWLSEQVAALGGGA